MKKIAMRSYSWLRLSVGLILLTAVGLSLSACSRRPDALQEIQARGTLLIGLDPSYPPFEALAPDGGLYGVDVDLGQVLAQQLGVQASFVFVGYDGLYHALDVGEVDLLLSALVIEPGRSDEVTYSRPYFDVGLALVVRQADEGLITQMRQLDGRSLAVEYATEGDVQARSWARRLDDLEIVPLTTAEDALSAVLAGQAEAALVDGISARLFLRDHPELVMAPELVTSEPYAVAMRAEDRLLARAIDDALQQLMTDGELETILGRWLER